MNRKYGLALFVVMILIAAGGYYFYSRQEVVPLSEQNDTNTQAIDSLVDAEKPVIEGVPPIAEGEAMAGSLEAPVKLIVYCSFTSDYCPEFLATAEQARIDFGDQLAIAYRPWYDRTDLLGEASAVAAYCAGQEGRSKEFTTGLFEYTRNGELSSASIDQVAGQIGLTAESFVACRQSKDTLATVTAIVDAASAASVTGAPTFFLNGYIYAGAYPYEDFERSDGSKEKGLRTLIEEEIGG